MFRNASHFIEHLQWETRERKQIAETPGGDRQREAEREDLRDLNGGGLREPESGASGGGGGSGGVSHATEPPPAEGGGGGGTPQPSEAEDRSGVAARASKGGGGGVGEPRCNERSGDCRSGHCHLLGALSGVGTVGFKPHPFSCSFKAIVDVVFYCSL